MGAVFLDQVGPLAEPRVILRVVSGRLGGEVLEVLEHLDADRLFVCDFRAFDRLEEGGVHVLAVVQQFEVERLVVDAGALVLEFFRF